MKSINPRNESLFYVFCVLHVEPPILCCPVLKQHSLVSAIVPKQLLPKIMFQDKINLYIFIYNNKYKKNNEHI